MLGMTSRWRTGAGAVAVVVVEEAKDWARTWMMEVKSEVWVWVSTLREESVM